VSYAPLSSVPLVLPVINSICICKQRVGLGIFSCVISWDVGVGMGSICGRRTGSCLNFIISDIR